MKGFKNFLMRGNLIDLAVAFIIGGAFSKVVEAFTKIILDIIGRVAQVDAFSQATVAGITIGGFLTAVISFVIIAFVVYFGMVKPYEAIKARSTTAVEETPSTEALLTEIRDLLAKKN
jgi:large conductance mechanosensitive channel